MSIVKTTNSLGILALALNADGRNRSVYLDRFKENLDPEGIHVLARHLVHNDIEMRTQWLVKMKDAEQPAEIWLDVDFEVLESVIVNYDTEVADVSQHN